MQNPDRKQIIEFDNIVALINESKQKIYKTVNYELIELYWNIGKQIEKLLNTSNYGDKLVPNIADYIRENYPDLKGFTKENLYRMHKFYIIYKDDEIGAPLVHQISWTNNLLIMSGTKTKEERIFYLKLCIKEQYSKRELDRQISSAYYERYMLSDGKAKTSNNKTVDEDDYPDTKLLDSYSLEFLDLPNDYNEKNLQNAIIDNLKDFILETGKSFSFMGREYKVQIGNHDYFIDLLFYNRELKCLVAFELKVGEFKPEYVSKMDFYLEVLDRNVKNQDENPSVGVILCAEKDNAIVEYALSRSMSPMQISEYSLKLPDKKLLEKKLKQFLDVNKK